MSSGQLEIQGQLTVGGQQCGPCDDAGQLKTVGLALRCGNNFFKAIASTDKSVQVTTGAGLFEELPCTELLDTIELLYVFAQSAVTLRIDAAPAVLTSTGVTLPLAGGETLLVDFDGVSVAVTFSAAATLQTVVNEINAAAALAGLGFLPASINAAGQLQLSGVLTADQGSVDVTGGTGQAALGFAAAVNDSAIGGGHDIEVNGLCLLEFGKTASIERVQISGTALIDVLAAGTAA